MAKHLTIDERFAIKKLRLAGLSYEKIAKHLNRAKSTVQEEIKRNSHYKNYCPVLAEEKAQRRAKKARVPRRMSIPRIREYVITHLGLTWSPEQISGRLKYLHAKDTSWWISAETIYKWIWGRKKRGCFWHKHLRSGLKNKGRRRGRTRENNRGKIKDRIGIEERPPSVDTRRFVGDWEGDTVVGKNGLGRIASWVERKSRYTCLAWVNGHKSQALNEAILARFEQSPDLPIRTVTLDNGKEFYRHYELSEAWKCKTYFSHPYHPWERGLNENTNGLLRQFLPRSLDFREISHEELSQTEKLLNSRPRKCLQYRTPEEVMAKLLSRTRSD